MKMDDSQIMVDIFGSCVTRAIFLDGKLEEKGCVDPRIKINYFFDKHPILSCVTPVPNTEVLNQNTIECIEKEELWQKTEHNLRGIKQELLKSTMPMIKESVAKYFIFDLYDFHTNLMIYDNTMFSPYKYEFFNTKLYQKNKSEFKKMFFPLDLPIGIWYGYVKLFFDEVIKKYGRENVIMVRFKACSHYMSKEKNVLPIPKNFLNPWMANARYNSQIKELEDRIISDYNPIVIDISKYYIGDEEYNSDLQGAHYSVEYYNESFKIMKKILLEDGDKCARERNYTLISYKGIANILKKDMSQEEFYAMWNIIESPIKEVVDLSVLERIAMFSDEFIVKNRTLIADIYGLADKLSYILDNDLFSKNEKNYIFNYEFEQKFIKPLDANMQTILRDTFGIEDMELILHGEDTIYYSFESIFDKFLILFENENIMWIDYLKQAEKLQPRNREVINYLLCYAEAIEDDALILEYQHKLNVVEY